MEKMKRCWLALLFLAGCSQTEQTERYSLDDDIAPSDPITVSHVDDAQPRYEPYSRGGNKDYTLRGKHYKIIKNPEGFTQTGDASWYGKKFHGHKTSNGEIYDMYSMTAAHKTLPIPSYVKVTNLANQRTAIVRVNDRGPFHEGRIIDLSYAAAQRLDVIKTGTAPVQIEVITVPKPGTDEVHIISDNHYFVQLGAVSDPNVLLNRANRLANTLDTAVSSQKAPSGQLYRVRLGPFINKRLAMQAQTQAHQAGFDSAYIIAEPNKQAHTDGVVSEQGIISVSPTQDDLS